MSQNTLALKLVITNDGLFGEEFMRLQMLVDNAYANAIRNAPGAPLNVPPPYLPLPFWFNRDPGIALPFVCLPYNGDDDDDNDNEIAEA
jgi:hypothetical protein